MTTLGPAEVLALHSYEGNTSVEMSFVQGEVISVLGQYDDSWWKGRINDRVGLFPASYVIGLDAIQVIDEPEEVKEDYQDDDYFDSYNTLAIHHQMLSDLPRTLCYKKAIESLGSSCIKGKRVLEVGAGTGVLSVFSAINGAEHVYAVEASDMVHLATSKVVKENDVSDKVTLIEGKVEEVALPVDKVDVLISEWMGSFLICESMIESIIQARNKYLKPNGLMMPSHGDIFLCPVEKSDFFNKYIDFWSNVSGVKMNSLAELARKQFCERPKCDEIVQPNELLCEPELIRSIDMSVVESKDLEEHSKEFKFTMKRDGVMHGFCSWFDVAFRSNVIIDNNEGEEVKEPIILSTSPFADATHWKQLLFLFKQEFQIKKGYQITGCINTSRNKLLRRHFICDISLCIHNINCNLQCKEEERDGCIKYNQLYRLWR